MADSPSLGSLSRDPDPTTSLAAVLILEPPLRLLHAAQTNPTIGCWMAK
jgi:hypothetical protein